MKTIEEKLKLEAFEWAQNNLSGSLAFDEKAYTAGVLAERARCQELAEDVADLVEDLNFYVSCTACEDNSPIRDEILENLKPFLKEKK